MRVRWGLEVLEGSISVTRVDVVVVALGFSCFCFFFMITSSSVIAAMLDDRCSTERLGLAVELALFSSICPFCVVGGTEFSKVAIRTALGFIVMGFIGFFVKLIFIPINNIIVGSG